MMELLSVQSITATDQTDRHIFKITADLGQGAEEVEYAYSPADPYGLNPEITAWWMAHPTFPIQPHVPVAVPLPDLAPYQFRAMLKLSGMQAALEQWIDGLAEPANTIARAKLEFSLVFKRNNDLVLSAQQVLGLTEQQLDELWMQAHAIE